VSRYRCVDAQKAAGFPVAAACTAAGVTRSAYYTWTARAAHSPAERHREEARLAAEIGRIHARSGGTYGAPRVHAELGRRGWAVNHCDDEGGGCGEGLTQSTTGLVPIA
jgi:putative transposase